MKKRFSISLICFLVSLIVFLPISHVNAYEVVPLFIDGTEKYNGSANSVTDCGGHITGYVYIQRIQTPNQGAYLRISKITSNADTYCKSVTSVSGTTATKSVRSKVTNGSTVDVYRTIKCSKHGTTKLSARVGGW